MQVHVHRGHAKGVGYCSMEQYESGRPVWIGRRAGEQAGLFFDRSLFLFSMTSMEIVNVPFIIK